MSLTVIFSDDESIIGTLSDTTGELEATLSDSGGLLEGNLSGDDGLIAELISFDADPYEGEYEVTPRLGSQTLDTDGKVMVEDLIVHEIPVVKTTNIQGGQTVLIG